MPGTMDCGSQSGRRFMCRSLSWCAFGRRFLCAPIERPWRLSTGFAPRSKPLIPINRCFGHTRDLQQWIEHMPEYSYARLVSGMFAGFSFLALALAAPGLFSVVSYTVAQRTNEFGIRMALGANGLEVLKLVFRSTATSVIGGLAGGMALSLVLRKFLSQWAEGRCQSPILFIAPPCGLMFSPPCPRLVPACAASFTS